jgi:hypothetical protein
VALRAAVEWDAAAEWGALSWTPTLRFYFRALVTVREGALARKRRECVDRRIGHRPSQALFRLAIEALKASGGDKGDVLQCLLQAVRMMAPPAIPVTDQWLEHVATRWVEQQENWVVPVRPARAGARVEGEGITRPQDELSDTLSAITTGLIELSSQQAQQGAAAGAGAAPPSPVGPSNPLPPAGGEAAALDTSGAVSASVNTLVLALGSVHAAIPVRGARANCSLCAAVTARGAAGGYPRQPLDLSRPAQSVCGVDCEEDFVHSQCVAFIGMRAFRSAARAPSGLKLQQ